MDSERCGAVYEMLLGHINKDFAAPQRVSAKDGLGDVGHEEKPAEISLDAETGYRPSRRLRLLMHWQL